jgi:hypothetical protein
MALVKFLLLSLAVLHASFDALPVNALAVQSGHLGRGLAHADIAKKRDSSKKCKPRPTSASPNAVTTTSSSVPSSGPSQPAQTTASSQSPPTYTPSSSSGGSKVLLAWSNNEQSSLGNFFTGQTDTIYNWALEKYSSDDLGQAAQVFEKMEFIPTVHSASDAFNIPNVLTAGYASRVFTFNEPEITGQASMSPDYAFQLWKSYIQPLTGKGYELFAPAVTTGSQGFDWITSFLKLCNGGCQISRMNLHYYGLQVEDFTSAIEQFHNAFNMQIWVTEIGCVNYSGGSGACDQATFNTLYSSAMSYVESSSVIEKISWFGFFTASELPNGVPAVNSMIDCASGPGADCKPNALGDLFINGKS